MADIKHKKQVTKPNNPAYDVSRDAWNEEHDIEEGSGRIFSGLDTDKATTNGVKGNIYLATDTEILYVHNGTTWIERTRGETATRLAYLAEKKHSSLNEIGEDDHHAKVHGSADHSQTYLIPADMALHESFSSGIHGVGSSTIESTAGSQAKVDAHKDLSTGVHGVGAGIIAKVSDIAIDDNLSSSAQDAISKKHTHSNQMLLDSYTQTNADLVDAVVKKHTHANQTLLDSYTQTEVNLADAVTKKHTHNNQTLLDSYTQTEINLADAVSKKHTHSNQTLLDSYTQTEVDLADAVSKKHTEAHTLASHSSKAHSELTGIEENDHHAKVHGDADHTETYLKTADMTTHEGKTTGIHGVGASTVDSVAARDSAIASHAGQESAHHTKFTTTEHDVTERHTLGTVVPHDALASLTEKSHTSLTDKGMNTHAQIDTHLAAAAPHSGHEQTTNKNQASGYAGLTAASKLNVSQMPTGKVKSAFTWGVEGNLTTGDKTFYLKAHCALTFTKCWLKVKTAPTGSAVIVDILKNGATIFSTKPQIAAGATEGSVTSFSVGTCAADDTLQINIDQVGSTTPGADLSVELIGDQTVVFS